MSQNIKDQLQSIKRIDWERLVGRLVSREDYNTSINSSVTSLFDLSIKDPVPVGVQACNPSGEVENWNYPLGKW